MTARTPIRLSSLDELEEKAWETRHLLEYDYEAQRAYLTVRGVVYFAELPEPSVSEVTC